MPRTYKSSAGSKIHNTYSQEYIFEALQAIKGGLSYRKCSEKYNIPTTVLHRHMKCSSTASGGLKMKKKGGQTVLGEETEQYLVDRLITCSSWGYPLDSYDLRVIVKSYLDRKGLNIQKFKDNMLGHEFAISFLKRHKNVLSERICQNIKRSRASVSHSEIINYFKYLEESIKDVPASHIINYDETNLCDDPGRTKIIAKRGCKYPERVMNSSKTSTSIMFACSGDGTMLPVYTVYKSQHLYDTWCTGGPKSSFYNRTISGWFDTKTFEDWLLKVIIPHVRT